MLRTVDVALSQIGVKELSGKNDGVPADRYMHGDKLPWCAGFVLWCNAQSDDVKLYTSNAEYFVMRAVADMERIMRARGWWRPFDPRVLPKENEVIFFANRGGSDAGPGRHVGVVASVFPDRIVTVEGNLGDSVGTASYRLADLAARVTGYGTFGPA